MEISGIELGHVAVKLNSILAGYYVNNIYLVNPNTVLVKLHHREKPEANLVLEADKGLWLTRYETSKTSGGVASSLRREILRAKVKSVSQPRGERIVVLECGEDADSRRVIVEFFGGGNIIVTDAEDKIHALLRPMQVRHRTLKIGGKYQLPPARGVDVVSLKIEDLEPMRTSDLEVSRWLGRNLALSKKYVEESLLRAGVDGKTVGVRLSDADVSRVFGALKEIADMVLRGDVEPTVVYSGGSPVDAAPFRLRSYEGLKSRGVGTFLEALDEVLSHEISSEAREAVSEPHLRKIEELKASIRQQAEAEVSIREDAEALRGYAERLRGRVYGVTGFDGVPTDLLLELGASDARVMKGRLTLKIRGATIEADSSQSLMKLSSQIFDEAKSLGRKVEAIRSAKAKLEKSLERLEREREEREVEVKAEKPEVRRVKAWYERYRWFKTSDGLLAVGGRDASTNSVVLSRYTETGDLVFHADLHGSPFFVLKGYSPSCVASVQEVAQTVVIFSRAWKDGVSSADAYWVHPDQVSREAPSGMYLARGSFMIYGSKNYVKNLGVECAVGLTAVDDYLTAMAGSQKAVRRNSVAYVVLTPDRGKVSDTAKKIRLELTRLLGGKVGDYVRRMAIDDFVRVLPSGGGRIVLKRLGEQRFKAEGS